MQRRRKYRIFALALLGATVVLVSTAFLSAMHSARFVGATGKMQDDRFLLQSVDPGSPAAEAGLRNGDLIVAIDGASVSYWYDVANARLSDYQDWRQSWTERAVAVTALREGEQFSTAIAARPLRISEYTVYFLPRFAIIVVMIALTVFMLISNPKDSTALFVAICFFAFIWWMGFDRPGWPKFLSPILMMYSPAEFLLRELMVTFGMQVAISALLHVMLVFPGELLPGRFRKPAIAAAYAVPSGTMALVIAQSIGDNLVDELPHLYDVRIWMDTSLLVFAAALIVVNSRRQRTKIQQEQGRWLMRAVVAFTLIHVTLWNLPKILTGVPLLPSYNWILLSVLLIPIALTVSIANHGLFGISGLIRRRIRYLKRLSERQMEAVGRRDDVIRSLSTEVEQLRYELAQYIASDESPDTDSATVERLERLEEDYPAIRDARRTHLLACSGAARYGSRFSRMPCWPAGATSRS